MLALVCLKFGVVAFIKQVIDRKANIVAGAAVSAQASSFDAAEHRAERKVEEGASESSSLSK